MESGYAASIKQSQNFPAKQAATGELVLKRANTLAQWQPFVSAGVSITDEMAQVLSQFWGSPVQVVFLGVSQQMHYFWRLEDFHVSRLQLDNIESTAPAGNSYEASGMALLRLSDTTCDALLSDVLGERPESFSFKQLSVLEASILNEMSRDLLLCFKKKLMKKPGRKSQAKLLHFIWAVSAQPQQESVGQEHAMSDVSSPTPAKFHKIGKIILSLPANAVQVAKHKQQEQAEPIAMSQEDSFFFHVIGEANLFLGDTRIMLSDLDQLEPGDLIVLENSHVSRMFIIEPESKEKIPFPVEISQRHAITIPYKQEFDPMESQQQQSSSRQALWDNLMIEVNAEFEPVKLPLKQLKQMTEGLVIEMGDLIHNGLRLQVEGKTLAWGELIIVGDKFGVRIRKVGDVESGSHASESPYPQIAADHHPAAVNASTAEESGENTDPESFLNEDFDEDDDSEDW